MEHRLEAVEGQKRRLPVAIKWGKEDVIKRFQEAIEASQLQENKGLLDKLRQSAQKRKGSVVKLPQLKGR